MVTEHKPKTKKTVNKRKVEYNPQAQREGVILVIIVCMQ